MDAQTQRQIEQVHHRFAALSMLVMDAMAILASIAPEEFEEVLSRHRLLVDAIEDGTFQGGDRSLLAGHQFIREILEKARERAEEAQIYADAPNKKVH
jgi:hypothetical protein